MKRMALVLALTVGVGVGTIGNQMLLAQTPVTRTILQQKDLEGAEGRELIMYRADFIPDGVLGRHFHPGPELIYVLEGALTLEQDGHPPVTLKAGDSAHLPHKHIHRAKNGSSTGPAKVLVFLVGEKGQPIITLVK
ncbi:MAG: cupin domain-containing protein [Candidatus Rokubacteria bacterium]|nr:cupin domain-containing protein [Candidatus Rokubacteria bacterium]